jgi:hypothetical protein
VAGGSVIVMPIQRMTAQEHVRQRALVVASLLILGEEPRPLRELAIDPGTYAPSAAGRPFADRTLRHLPDSRSTR